MTDTPPHVHLGNCDREPIHIPGLVQPHGALLAFDRARTVVFASDNVAALLGDSAPQVGQNLAGSHFAGNATVHQTLGDAQDMPASNGVPVSLHTPISLNERLFDMVAHRIGSLLVLEFELRPDIPLVDHGPQLHALTQRLRLRDSVTALLEEVVKKVREITGFDRVMAYRFAPDDSGEVMAEARAEHLEPYLGWRYPASDIPAQARRLYTQNPLRLIADVNAAPVPVRAAADADAPLDMSHCVLRSVSPIHIEYLQNIKVGASMSVSIIHEGRLWGMIACHHTEARQVPYPLRSACAVLVELLAAHLKARLSADDAACEMAHERLRTTLLDRTQAAPRPAAVLAEHAEDIAEVFHADAVVVADHHRLLRSVGDVSAQLASELVHWMNQRCAQGEHTVQTSSLAERVPQVRGLLQGWAGMLGICFGEPANMTLLLLRREQVQTIHWGHDPAKQVTTGPSGARLTPPGSFELWRETVRDTAKPWGQCDVDSIRHLREDLGRFFTVREAEMERHRAVASDMVRGGNLSGALADDSTRASVGRLLRQVVDINLLRYGQMALQFQPVDLLHLIAQRVEQRRREQPSSSIFFALPRNRVVTRSVMVSGDAERLTQLIDNLLDNALRYSTKGESVVVAAGEDEGWATLEVSNDSPPISPAVVANLFSPLAPASTENHPAGLGFGLYVCRAIAQAHGGELTYQYDEPFVTMKVRLPLLVNP